MISLSNAKTQSIVLDSLENHIVSNNNNSKLLSFLKSETNIANFFVASGPYDDDDASPDDMRRGGSGNGSYWGNR